MHLNLASYKTTSSEAVRPIFFPNIADYWRHDKIISFKHLINNSWT